ncbi:MAG: PAS domain S-box protein, partial [Burkholderiaceae bacterium]
MAKETTNAVVLTKPDGRIQWVNEGFSRISGYTLNEAMGHKPGHLLQCPETDLATVAVIRQALTNLQPCEVEILNRSKAGELYWVELQIQPLFDADGRHTGFMAIESDITKRREDLDQLQRAMRENHALMQAIDQATIYSVADLQGKIVEINDAFVRISGYSRDELIGANHRLLNSGVQPDGFWREAWATFSSGQAWHGEVCNRAKDGSLYWVDSTIVPFKGADGLVEKYISIRTDITETKNAQLKLDAQRQRLDNIINGTHVGTWEWHVPSGQTIFNERWAEIIGYTLAELDPVSIETWMRFAHPEDLKRSGQALERHFSGELAFYEVESRMRHKQGHWVWVLDRGQVATREADGSPGWMFGTHQDISEQKQMETALRLSEARMKALSELSAHWFWETDSEHRFTRFATGNIELLHVLNTLALGKSRFEMGVEPMYTSWEEHKAVLARRETFLDFQYRRIDADGKVVYWSVSGMPWYDNQGDFVGYIGSGFDISERKNAEVRLARSEALLERTAQIAKVGAWRVDLKTGQPEWSAETCRIHEVPVGYQPDMEEALNFYAPEARPVITEAVKHGLETGQGWDLELPFITATGRHIWVRALGQVEEIDGKPAALVGAFQDITEQKAQAVALLAAKTQAEQASLFKSQFLANMSHEIRTPMNAILGMLKLLHTTSLQPRQLDYVEKTEGAAKSLLGLLNDILDFSKVEAGKMTLDPQPFSLDKLLRDLAVIFSASVGNKPVEVLFDIDPNVPRQLVGDSLRLQQILINLGGNAIKFTSQGEVVLRVQLVNADVADSDLMKPSVAHLHFAVKDSGIGIAPENQHKIFAGFTQAEASTTRRFGGTGLGLSICRRLIELMGGELRLDSALGHGSTFSFCVPLPLADISPEKPLEQPDSQRAMAVLVVDDNSVARELMAAMAASLGWQVDVAESGEVALAMVQARAGRGEFYGAVFVDWFMPGL